jgi:hypothetical protein
MRELLLNALRQHYLGHIETARANVEVFLENPVGVGEHPDIAETMDKEISKIADASDKLKTLDDFFANKTPRI